MRSKQCEDLIQKIKARKIMVGVVGLGYVGLPLAVEKAKAGFHTIGFDIQPEKVKMVNRGENYIGDVAGDDLMDLVEQGMLAATNDFSFIEKVQFVAICVPTPLDEHQQPDISYVRDSAIAVAKHLQKGSMVVLESTTYPGTTEELLRPLLEEYSGLKCEKDFYLAFSPERVDPGNLIYKTKNTPKVVGAIGEDASACIAEIYREVLESDVLEVSSPAVAEMEKILENTYRNINIGLVNELAMLCHEMRINVWEVVDAAKTKPYGFQAFYPGPGLGGHCIPLDPYYLAWKAREYGFHTSMIETAGMINDRMPRYCAERASHILNRMQRALCGADILILGVAYKQNIADFRESPALRVIEALEAGGARIRYYDPYVPEFQYKGKTRKSIKHLNASAVSGADLVIITTAHTEIDYDMVAQNAQAVFDTKNAMKEVYPRDNVELL
ncbi:MAG: nucleotide sugar dehydrogenase [Acetanaerobacterium sp.]